MPPKKKDEKGKVSEPADTADEQKLAMETELLVSVLKSRLGRYQEAGEKLAIEGFKLADELAKQKLTLQDINEFLTNELKARSVATTQLEERVLELTKQMQDVQKEAQAEVGRIRAEAAAQVSAAEIRVESLRAQLDSSADFLGRREQLEAELANLREQLAAKHKEAEQKLSDMERRHLQDKEKMKQEMTAKIRETKLNMAQLADQHLESSTKRTLVENEAMAAELAYHSVQSSKMAEANNTLRAEAAEMRRQLAVAQKTVESTARKNLLLQQTIKAILKCLQEEASTAATAGTTAAAAGTSQHLKDCIGLNLLKAAGSDAVYDNTEQLQQQNEGQQHELLTSSTGLFFAAADGDHGVSCNEALQQLQQLQQQQHTSSKQEGSACADIAADIVEQLEHKVVNLSDELDAAKQALAAALQGLIPEGAAGNVHVVYQQQHKLQCGLTASRDLDEAGPQLTVSKLSPSYESISSKAPPGSLPVTALAIPASPSGSSSSRSGPSSGRGRSRNRSHSPASCWLQQGHRGWGTVCDSVGEAYASVPGAGAAAMAAALEDGVAAFVLYCVQQLRRGTSQAPAAAAPAGKEGSNRTSILHSGSEAFGSFGPGGASVGNSTCSSPTGRSRQHGRGAAAAVAMRSVSPSMLGLGLNTQSLIGYAPADSENKSTGAPASPAASTAVNESANKEHLARLLLEQLHGYAQHKVAAFQGMQLELQGCEAVAGHKQQQAGEPEPLHCQPAATPQTNEDGVVMGNSRGRYLAAAEGTSNSDNRSQLLQEGPSAHPLLLMMSDAAAWPSSRRNSAAAHQGGVRTSGAQAGLQVLPPLPSLLGMERSQTSISTPATPATQYYPAAVDNGSYPAGEGQTATRSSTEDLFGALLSNVRPWGGALPAPDCRNQLSEGSSSSMVRDRGGRSPSPLGINPQLNGDNVPSPKPSKHTVVAVLQAHGAGVGSLSNSSSCSSISAGRLVKVGEAAGLASNLAKPHREQDSNGLQGALMLNAIRSKAPT